MQHAIYWQQIDHTDPRALAMADRHYSRRSPGTPEFMAAGHKIVLIHFMPDGTPAALWGSHRPAPDAGLDRPRFDGLDVWDCSIFRVEQRTVEASTLIREAVAITRGLWNPLPANGFYTTIDPKRVAPMMRRGKPVWGYCYRKAGWIEQEKRTGRGYIVYTLPLEQLSTTIPAQARVALPPFGTVWRRWARATDDAQLSFDLV